jgi:hypothetical protein
VWLTAGPLRRHSLKVSFALQMCRSVSLGHVDEPSFGRVVRCVPAWLGTPNLARLRKAEGAFPIGSDARLRT